MVVGSWILMLCFDLGLFNVNGQLAWFHKETVLLGDRMGEGGQIETGMEDNIMGSLGHWD